MMIYDDPPTYKVVTISDHDGDPVYLVTPHWVTAQEVALSEAGISQEAYDCVCEAYSYEAAKLIADLLTQHSETMVTVQ